MTDVDQQLVRSEFVDGVAHLHLMRSDRRNAVNNELVAQLHAAVLAASGARVITLRADGDHFSVGGDVMAMAAAPDMAEFIAGLAGAAHEYQRALVESSAISVVGVRGWATGIGFSFALAADIAIAAESARFKPAYPGVGLSPDGGLSWLLPRIVGRQRALHMLLADEVIDAHAALSLGLVSKVVPDADLDAELQSLASSLAAASPVALAAAKRLVHEGLERTFTDQLGVEAASITGCSTDPDTAARIRAFGKK